MSPIQAAILATVRANKDLPIADKLAAWDDDELVRRIFANFRDERKLRITLFGQQLLQRLFRSYEFEIDELQPLQSVYLAKHSKMPYYLQGRKLVVYDPEFAIRLRLAGDSIATLVEIDTFHS